MPIYAYKCESCGHRQDVLQKMSDPVLQTCPACAQPRFVKQLTAAGFQLKGSGWYATDFRGDKKPPAAAETDEAKPAKPAEATTASTGDAVAAKPAKPAAAPAPATAKPSAPPSDTA